MSSAVTHTGVSRAAASSPALRVQVGAERTCLQRIQSLREQRADRARKHISRPGRRERRSTAGHDHLADSSHSRSCRRP